MLYKFPEIKHFSDIEKYIDPDLFYVAMKDGYKVINYHVATPETFPDISDEKSKIVREFRGIIFDMEGNIIRRPYQKFHNIGERPDTRLENIDISKPHKILEKLDGSMIAPFRVDERIIFGTKLGETEASKDPQTFAESRENYINFATALLDTRATPIFEWTSNKNRIVLDYPQDNLILTGIRKMVSGEYYSYEQMKEMAGWFNIPVVKMFKGGLSQSLIDQTRSSEGIEGIVVRFDEGGMAKLKADSYVALHRVKSDINNERNVVALILGGKIDDLKPLLSKEDLLRVNEFEINVSNVLIKINEELLSASMIADIGNRKDFALNKTISAYSKHMIFSIWENLFSNNFNNVLSTTIINFILKNCNTNTNYKEMKKSGNMLQNLPDWKSPMFSTDE